MRNPWEEIRLDDYEGHMKLDTVWQLQALNKMMQGQLSQYPVKTIMILGIAGGNGLEHVPAASIESVYGVDINPEYLAVCERRYPQLKGVLKTICADLQGSVQPLPEADLVVADLLIEYIGYDCFCRVLSQVKPRYVSCVIQVNTDETFVSDSPYLPVFENLTQVHRQITEEGLIKSMEAVVYKNAVREMCALPNGKQLVRLDFTADVK